MYRFIILKVEGQNKSINKLDGREIRLTTGLYAPQASGSVMIECGDTSLLVTATKTAKKEPSDFLPLICDYEEKLYKQGGFLVVSWEKVGHQKEHFNCKINW